MTPVHLVDHGATLEIVGLTISLHVAGMFALSPVFGWLVRPGRPRADDRARAGAAARGAAVRLDRRRVQGAVMAGLILLGLGWSASTVAASALVAESADPLRRTVIQGRADLLMSAAGAAAARSPARRSRRSPTRGSALVAIALVVVVLIAVGLRTARRARQVV